MKLALIAFILFPLISFAQIDENKINTYTIEGGKLYEVAPKFIEEIGKSYLFSEDMFPRKTVAPKIFRNCTIEDVLDYLMEGTNMELTYNSSSGVVRLVKRTVSEKIYITGTVASHTDGGGIHGVHVSTQDPSVYATTEYNGNYTLSVDKNAFDTLQLEFTHVAFMQVSGILVLSYYMNKERTILNKVMKPKTIELKPYDFDVKIGASSSPNGVHKINLKDYIATKEELSSAKFSMMPGSDQFYRQEGGVSFRGSSPDISSFLIEGRTIKNPFKDKGQIPVVGKNTVKNVTTYEGVAPAKYAGSAVVFDIETGDGNLIQPDFDLIFTDRYSQLTFSGPIETDASSFLVDFRSSYYTPLLRKQIEIPPVFNSPFNVPTDFTDGTVKLTATRDYNKFTFFANYSSETIRENISWGSFGQNYSFQNIKTEQTNIVVDWENTDFASTRIKVSTGYSDYNKGIRLLSNIRSEQVNPVGGEKGFFLTGTVFRQMSNQISMESGFTYDHLRYGLDRSRVPEGSMSGFRNMYTSMFLLLEEMDSPVNKYAFYSQVDGNYSNLKLSMGLRYTALADIKSSRAFEPRVLVKYVPLNRPNSTIEFKYGRMVIYEQSLQLNSLETFAEFPLILPAIKDCDNHFSPHSFHEIDLNYKIQAFKGRVFFDFGHFAKFSKNQLFNDGEEEQKIDTVYVLRQEEARSTLLGISISGGVHLDHDLNISFMISLKDSSKEMPRPLHFDYKFGFNIGKSFFDVFDLTFSMMRFKDLLFEGEDLEDSSVSSAELKLGYSPNTNLGVKMYMRYFDSEVYNLDRQIPGTKSEIGFAATLSL